MSLFFVAIQKHQNSDTDAEAMFKAYRVSSQLVLYLSFEKKKFGNMFTSTCAVQEVHTHIMLQITTYGYILYAMFYLVVSVYCINIS